MRLREVVLPPRGTARGWVPPRTGGLGWLCTLLQDNSKGATHSSSESFQGPGTSWPRPQTSKGAFQHLPKAPRKPLPLDPFPPPSFPRFFLPLSLNTQNQSMCFHGSRPCSLPCSLPHLGTEGPLGSALETFTMTLFSGPTRCPWLVWPVSHSDRGLAVSQNPWALVGDGT